MGMLITLNYPSAASQTAPFDVVVSFITSFIIS